MSAQLAAIRFLCVYFPRSNFQLMTRFKWLLHQSYAVQAEVRAHTPDHTIDELLCEREAK